MLRTINDSVSNSINAFQHSRYLSDNDGNGKKNKGQVKFSAQQSAYYTNSGNFTATKGMEDQILADEFAAVTNNYYGMKSHMNKAESYYSKKSSANSTNGWTPGRVESSTRGQLKGAEKHLPNDFGNFELDFLKISKEDVDRHRGQAGPRSGTDKKKLNLNKKKQKTVDYGLQSQTKNANRGISKTSKAGSMRGSCQAGKSSKHSRNKTEEKRNYQTNPGSQKFTPSNDRHNVCATNMINFLDEADEDAENMIVGPEFMNQMHDMHFEDVFTMDGDKLMSLPYFSLH